MQGSFSIKKHQTAKLKINHQACKKDKKQPIRNMPFTVCTCGAKILVVPDVAAMSRALKNHLTCHKNADEQDLIKQIFEVSSSHD